MKEATDVQKGSGIVFHSRHTVCFLENFQVHITNAVLSEAGFEPLQCKRFLV